MFILITLENKKKMGVFITQNSGFTINLNNIMFSFRKFINTSKLSFMVALELHGTSVFIELFFVY